MNPGSRRAIHRGINFVVAPPPIINPRNHLGFQEALISRGIGFGNVSYQEQRIEIVRKPPESINVAVIASSDQPVGQLLIVAPGPGHPLEMFIQETELIVEAFEQVWTVPQRQILKRDVSLRDLYETDQHAFQELWETRLGQPQRALAAFGRPVQGGGLRFVMPPHGDKPAQIEVKIESYLRDTTKFFVETQFTWPFPTPPGESFRPREYLVEVDNYANKQVLAFMLGRGETDADN
jgi:hypothetical protein